MVSYPLIDMVRYHKFLVASFRVPEYGSAGDPDSGSKNPVLLRYHVSGGHSGGEPLEVQVNNAAETLAFLDWQLR